MAGNKAPNDVAAEADRVTDRRFVHRSILFFATEDERFDAAAARTAIRKGKIRGSHFKALRRALDLTVEQVTTVIGSAPRTISRKEQGENFLSLTEGDRAYRIARIADMAAASLGDTRRAVAWLSTPNSYLGNETPLQSLDTELGTTYVEQSLAAVAYGGVA